MALHAPWWMLEHCDRAHCSSITSMEANYEHQAVFPAFKLCGSGLNFQHPQIKERNHHNPGKALVFNGWEYRHLKQRLRVPMPQEEPEQPSTEQSQSEESEELTDDF
uniref:Myotubularin phosphatase domain-containing protein n=1 Tax=Steinernema glaseri TaxID=37863 RepID=A0A1I7Z9K7_9BILA